MDDRDYIRKAVELADGFDCYDDGLGLVITYAAWQANINNSAYNKAILDALAAQLVRQVDETDYGITFDGTDQPETIVWGSHLFTPIVKSCSFGPDRTMNTIKAIVDSKVLEND